MGGGEKKGRYRFMRPYTGEYKDKFSRGKYQKCQTLIEEEGHWSFGEIFPNKVINQVHVD